MTDLHTHSRLLATATTERKADQVVAELTRNHPSAFHVCVHRYNQWITEYEIWQDHKYANVGECYYCNN